MTASDRLANLLNFVQATLFGQSPGGGRTGQTISVRVAGRAAIRAVCLQPIPPGEVVLVLTQRGWAALPATVVRQVGTRQIEFRKTRGKDPRYILTIKILSRIDNLDGTYTYFLSGDREPEELATITIDPVRPYLYEEPLGYMLSITGPGKDDWQVYLKDFSLGTLGIAPDTFIGVKLINPDGLIEITSDILTEGRPGVTVQHYSLVPFGDNLLAGKVEYEDNTTRNILVKNGQIVDEEVRPGEDVSALIYPGVSLVLNLVFLPAIGGYHITGSSFIGTNPSLNTFILSRVDQRQTLSAKSGGSLISIGSDGQVVEFEQPATRLIDQSVSSWVGSRIYTSIGFSREDLLLFYVVTDVSLDPPSLNFKPENLSASINPNYLPPIEHEIVQTLIHPARVV